ncbi:LysR substrate-binding domain-containing protein [Burkholderia sp. HI4860]|uniref:LysR substrate-binding domain-containing protein n=1 Tax=Burkholderia sp. HI4860 TaxID=2015361 RepID=UPI0032422ECB
MEAKRLPDWAPTTTICRCRLGRVHSGYAVSSTEAVKHAVHAGLGISLVMESAVKHEQASGWLHAIPIEEDVYKDLYLVHRSETSLSGPVASLADLILHSPDLGSIEYK